MTTSVLCGSCTSALTSSCSRAAVALVPGSFCGGTSVHVLCNCCEASAADSSGIQL